MRIRGILLGFLGCLFQLQATASPFEMDVLETDDLRLLYFDPFQTYLVPHVVRNFHNSLEFQKYIYGWEPQEKTTIMVSSHNLAEIQELCDHVAIMDHGKVVLTGTVDEITRANREVYLGLSRPLAPKELERRSGRLKQLL